MGKRWGKEKGGFMVIDEVEDIAHKIETMEIRGAGKIARSAARALKIQVERSESSDVEELVDELEKAKKILMDTRPTAVSLANSVNFVTRNIKILAAENDLDGLKEKIVARAEDFIEKSEKSREKLGEIGSRRISDGDTILTHCHSTNALAVIKTAYEQGKDIQVIATEARPRQQGLITVEELSKHGIPITLIVDSAVRFFMKEVDKVVVGADSIAANGAVVNKIGTSQLALAAHEARVLTFVAAESYKFHPSTLVGELVEIEERDPGEVVDPERFPGVEIRNPAFDVTPPEYIDLIITEKGIIPPEAAYGVLQEQFEMFEGSDIF